MNVQGLIGWNVARLRQRMRLSQEQVAQSTGIVDQSYISGLEHGKRNPTAVVLVHIADALGVQVGELFSIYGAPANLTAAQTMTKLSGRQKKTGSN